MKKKKANGKKEKTTKKKVCEIFKIGKKGKQKTIKTCGTEEEKKIAKGQVKSENKILRNCFIVMGALALAFIVFALIINSMKHFEYEGIEFDVIREGKVIFYHTSFPIIYNEKNLIYNVYLRNDPRKLKDIPFEGSLNLLEMMVINNTESFVCEGHGGIAMYNFQQILGAFGIELMKDPDANCDPYGRYMFVKIQPGNVTSIEQTGPACYNFNVNNCEILKVTEKFLVETLVKLLGEN